jgi:alpha-glucosidase
LKTLRSAMDTGKLFLSFGENNKDEELLFAESYMNQLETASIELPATEPCTFSNHRDTVQFSPGGKLSFQVGSNSASAEVTLTQDPSIRFHLSKEDQVFGAGAISSEASLQKGTYELINRDTVMGTLKDSPYASLPVIWLKSAKSDFLALVLITTYPVSLIYTEDKLELIQRSDAETTSLKLAFFWGEPQAISRSLAACLGYASFPPLWSLGLFQSRWSYKSQKEVLQIAERYRREGLPCDGIYLDIHYMDGFKVFTWNSKKFRNPELMHESLRDAGFRTVAILDPGVKAEKGYSVYEQGKKDNIFARDESGEIFHGKVWPGKTVFPDFSLEKVREFWATLHQNLFDKGVSGIWNDMNDPVLVVNSLENPLHSAVRFELGSHRKFRNAYANYMGMSTQKGFAKFKEGLRPFVLSRSGTLGVQQHAWLWTGDNHSTWSDLKANLAQVINLGLSGVPFSGADIGGFAAGPGVWGLYKFKKKKELFIRWMELGAMMPLFRIHSCLHSHRQEPWSYGKQALSLIRNSIELRYRLIHYFYLYAKKAAESGAPIVRPLWYHDYGSGKSPEHSLFFVGKDLFVAPVFEKGKRQLGLTLPKGDWYHYYTGEYFAGDAYYSIEAPLGKLQLFVRAGSALPMATIAENTEATVKNSFAMEVFPANKISGMVMLDDGVSNSGKYWVLQLAGKQDAKKSKCTLKWKVSQKGFSPGFKSFVIRLPARYRRVRFKNKEHSLQPMYAAHELKEYSFVEFHVPLKSESLEAFEV